jgi:hypothetical protein
MTCCPREFYELHYYSSENMKERDLLGDGRITNIIRDHKEIGCDGVDWIHLPHNAVQWQALVNTVMNLQILHTINLLTS